MFEMCLSEDCTRVFPCPRLYGDSHCPRSGREMRHKLCPRLNGKIGVHVCSRNDVLGQLVRCMYPRSCKNVRGCVLVFGSLTCLSNYRVYFYETFDLDDSCRKMSRSPFKVNMLA